MTSGLLKKCEGVLIKGYTFKVKQWSGHVNVTPREPPPNLDWDLTRSCGRTEGVWRGPRLHGRLYAGVLPCSRRSS